MSDLAMGIMIGVILTYGYGLIQLIVLWLLWNKGIVGDKKDNP